MQITTSAHKHFKILSTAAQKWSAGIGSAITTLKISNSFFWKATIFSLPQEGEVGEMFKPNRLLHSGESSSIQKAAWAKSRATQNMQQCWDQSRLKSSQKSGRSLIYWPLFISSTLYEINLDQITSTFTIAYNPDFLLAFPFILLSHLTSPHKIPPDYHFLHT